MSAGAILDRRQDARLRAGAARARVLAAQPAVAGAAALTVLAAVLRFVYIGHQGFWFDEGNTVLLVHLSPGGMLGLIPQSESTPPLYYCLAWIWARVFGFSEAPLRSLSALAGICVVPVAFAIGRRLVSDRVGLVAAALVACNPLLIWYSQEARAYELLVLLCAASLLALLYASEEASPRRLSAWALAGALALATHYYAVLVVAPEALWLLWRRRSRREAGIAPLLAVGAVAVCGLALVPLAVHQNATGRGNWIAGAPLGQRLSQIVPQFLVGFQLPAYTVWAIAAGVVAGAGVLVALLRADEGVRRAALGLAALALSGLVLNLLFVAAGVDDLLTRNAIALWLPAALAVSVGLGSRRAGPAGILAAVALCAIGVTSAIAVDADRSYQRPDWRGVARLLGSHPAAGIRERVILIQHYRDLLPLSLYLPGLHFLGHRQVAHPEEFDVVSFTSPASGGFCWWGPACNLWPSRMQATYAIPGFHVVWRRQIYQFTVLRMVADRPRPVTLAEAGRALTSRDVRERWELIYQR